MTSRDDMVITPRLKPRQAATPVRAREERQVAGVKRKRGILGRLARAHAARKMVRARRARRRRPRGGGGGKLLVTGAAAVMVAAAVVARLASGKSFETIGRKLSNAILGDSAASALASMETRRRFQSDSDLTRIVGQENGVNSQIRSIFNDLYELRKREVSGSFLLLAEEGLQVNSAADILILRGRDAIREGFNRSGGQNQIDKIREKMRNGPYRESMNDKIRNKNGGPR